MSGRATGRLRLIHGQAHEETREWSLTEGIDAYTMRLRKEGRSLGHVRSMEWVGGALGRKLPEVMATPVGSLTNRHLEAIRLEYADKKPITQRLVMALIKRGMTEAARMERGQPKVGLIFKTPKVTNKLRYLSKAEFEVLLDTLGSPVGDEDGLRLVAVGLAYTGMRYSELLGVRWEDVCWRAEGAGTDEWDSIKVWGNKTQKERIVPLTGRLSGLLRGAKAAGHSSPFPAQPSPRAMAARLNHAFDQAGLNPPENVRRYGKATVHSLRHTYASWLLQSGATLDEVSKMLGHSSIMMTQRYAHLSVGNTVNKVGTLLNNL